MTSRRLVRDHQSSARWLQIILDFILVVGLLYLHTTAKGAEFSSAYRELAILTLPLMTMIYHNVGVYRQSRALLDHLLTLARAWLIVLALLVAAAFITKTSTAYSREVFLTWAVTGYIAQLAAFFLVRYLQMRSKKETIPTLIIGADKLGQHLAAQINANPWIPDHVVGFITEDSEQHQEINQLPVFGDVSKVTEVIAKENIKRVYLALPMHRSEWIQPLYMKLTAANIDVIWAPDIFSVNLLNHSIRELGGLPLISLSEAPLIGGNAFVKSIMDIGIATTAIIITSPILLLTALSIKLTSRGPVLFSQERHGFNDEVITVFKFRSMRVHEEEEGTVTQASKADQRITTVGKIIRRTSIDELPQLWNVLNGSMSIVGPRPHAVAHNAYYGGQIEDYMRRHRVKPGLTGLAQVNGFRGETRSIEQMEGRVQHDLSYIHNWSVWLDIKIILRTVFVMVDKNAY